MTSHYFPSILDSSMLATFKSCPEKFRKEYIEDWKSKLPSVHLHAGAAFAKGLEVARTEYHVNGQPAENAVAAGMGALLKAYGNFECPADSAKSAERMAGALEFYYYNYPLCNETAPIVLPNGKRAIEFSFAEALPICNPVTGDPLLYTGRADAIETFAGRPFVVDEKTTTQLGGSWAKQWQLRSQFTGYCWAAKRSGIDVAGALVRGVSILKTKYETQQVPTYRSDWQIDQWYRELLVWIEDIIQCWKTGIWRHNFDHSCADYGGCAFLSCCGTEDETPFLLTHFERRRWNPLDRTEEKVG
jgi:hypothetical protein